MKAQVLHKYDPEMKEKVWVTGEELPNPKIEKASDVIVKIGAAGVCRTDLHIIEGVWKHITDQNNDLLPMVMGHENAGWIEEVGKDVTGFKKGDAVILHPKVSAVKFPIIANNKRKKPVKIFSLYSLLIMIYSDEN